MSVPGTAWVQSTAGAALPGPGPTSRVEAWAGLPPSEDLGDPSCQLSLEGPALWTVAASLPSLRHPHWPPRLSYGRLCWTQGPPTPRSHLDALSWLYPHRPSSQGRAHPQVPGQDVNLSVGGPIHLRVLGRVPHPRAPSICLAGLPENGCADYVSKEPVFPQQSLLAAVQAGVAACHLQAFLSSALVTVLLFNGAVSCAVRIDSESL